MNRKKRQLKRNGFFDYELRMNEVKKKITPLDKLDETIPWNYFEEELEQLFSNKEIKGPGGRPPYNRLFMFKILVLQKIYNLSDEQTEFQINDRLSFQSFLGLEGGDKVPDQNTIWDFRESLNLVGGAEKLFQRFEQFLREQDVIMKEGVIVDASFVEVPRQRNSRKENAAIKKGDIPAEWEKKPRKKSQKDVDARWTKKNNVVHYGYKNHIKIDKKSKIICFYKVTSASVHDVQVVAELIRDEDKKVYGDKAYRSASIESLLKKRGIESCIHEKGSRDHPLTDLQKKKNQQRTKVRARVEHVFGFMATSMSDTISRYIGLKRTEAAIGLKNLVYNLLRYAYIKRLKLAPNIS